MSKIAILVDVQNIYYTTRQAFGCQFNYRAFWEKVVSGHQVMAAIAFAIQPQDAKQKGFQQILKDIGFDVRLKPYLQRRDGSAKADWDVGITLEMLDLAPGVDSLILASGDGDFDLAVQYVKRKFATETEVYGVRELTADSLIQSCDRFHAIGDSLLL